LEQRVFAAVNAQRARMGVPVLSWNNKVADQAREHSCRMAKLGFFSHDDPERGSSPERLGRAGIQSGGSAENIYRESGHLPSERSPALPKLDWDRSLVQQAKQLGLKPKRLVSALNRWAKSVTDPYDQGLAALYQGRYVEAGRFISQSIASSAGRRVERYVPLARAEYEQGNYEAAEAALRKVLAVHPADPLVVDNLAIVSSNLLSAAATDLVGRGRALVDAPCGASGQHSGSRL
jgi:tetratricopeptide (TPR) repeat protein